MLRLARIVLPLGVVLAVVALPAAVSWAGESSGAPWAATEAPLPANALASPSAYVWQIDCPAVGNCAADGQYNGTDTTSDGLLLSEANGTWTSIEAVPPANAGAGSPVYMEPVSCWAPGSCVAVGFYEDDSGNPRGALFTLANGSWSNGVEAPLPADADPTTLSQLTSIACPSVGHCVAVGYYRDTGGSVQGLILQQSGGTWTPSEIVLPANAGNSQDAVPLAISCSSAGNCAAVGNYLDDSHEYQGLAVAESNGTWGTGVELTPPADAQPDPNSYLSAVSCGASGDCAAGGSYANTDNDRRAMLVRQSGGTWGTGFEVPLPQDAKSPHGFATFDVTSSISCSGAGTCSAAGYYRRATGTYGSLLLDTSGNTWAVQSIQLPANVATDSTAYDYLESVSCPKTGECTAVGRYTDTNGNQNNLLLERSGGLWRPGIQGPLPADASGVSSDTYNVACAAPYNCAVAADYQDNQSHWQGLLLTSQTPGVASAGRAKVKGKKVKVPISCAGGTPCSVKLVLTKGKKKLIGKKSATIQPQATKTVIVSLNRAGLKYWKRGLFTAELRITQGKALVSKQKVTFRR